MGAATGPKVQREFHTLNLNAQSVEFIAGETVLQLCRRLGVPIPTLCFSERLNPLGSCRLCLVEIDGQVRSSCSTPACSGQRVETQTEPLQRLRKTVMSLLLSTVSGELSPEMRTCMELCGFSSYSVEKSALPLPLPVPIPIPMPLTKVPLRRKPVHPYIQENFERCIACLRCVAACEVLAGCHVLGTRDRSIDLVVRPRFEGDWLKSGCVSCGICIDECPTGAIQAPDVKLSKNLLWNVEESCFYVEKPERTRRSGLEFLATRVSEPYREGLCIRHEDAKKYDITDQTPLEIVLGYDHAKFRFKAILTVNTPAGIVHALTRNTLIFDYVNSDSRASVPIQLRKLRPEEVALPPDDSFEVR